MIKLMKSRKKLYEFIYKDGIKMPCRSIYVGNLIYIARQEFSSCNKLLDLTFKYFDYVFIRKHTEK